MSDKSKEDHGETPKSLQDFVVEQYKNQQVCLLVLLWLHSLAVSKFTLKGKVFDPGRKSPQMYKDHTVHLKSLCTNISKHHRLLGYNISPLTALINSSFQTKRAYVLKEFCYLMQIFLLF